MPNWFVIRNGSEQGPLTSDQLRSLAATGQLRPNDQVRREDISKPVRAESVKGLFGTAEPKPSEIPPVQAATPSPANASTTMTPLPSIPSVQAAASSASPPTNSAAGFEGVKKNLYHPALIAPALLCCFPAGLALVWTHPRWTILVKSLWSGGYFSCFVLFAVLGQIESTQARDELAAANKVWEAGDKASAVSKYRSLLKSHNSVLKDDEKSLLYGRVIDFDAQSGNMTSAKDLMHDATSRRIVPSVSSAEARQLVAAIEGERKEQERQQKAKSGTPREKLEVANLDEFVGASTLYSDFNSNEVAANEKYKGKTILVAGPVVSVEQSAIEGTTIDLAHQGRNIGIHCILSRSSARSDDLKRVSAGDWLKVRGYCKGKSFVGWVILSDCDFVAVNP